MANRVVVTGMGTVTALGDDLPTVWRRLLAGDNGITRIRAFDASDYTCKVAAEARTPPQDTGLASLPGNYYRRMVHLFVKAVREAYTDSGLGGNSVPPSEVGVAAGTTVNYIETGLLPYYFGFKKADAPELDMERFAREGEQPENSFFLRLGDQMAAAPAKDLGLAGPNLSIDTACAASAHAIGEAFRLIQRGRATAMIAGGASALVDPLGILAFSLLGALSRNPDPEQASRPFDRDRDGFVMGEGAGTVVLESLEHARRRGARIYGEIVGYGSTINAHNLTDPSPQGLCESRAMRLALREASLSPDSIDYVAAHGTSTLKNDEVETLAIKRVFGDHARRLLVSSNKGQIGHTIAAAGAFNLIFALKAINDDRVPPTVHYENRDPACDLDYVAGKCRAAKVKRVLANAFAFGGQNAVLAIQEVSA